MVDSFESAYQDEAESLLDEAGESDAWRELTDGEAPTTVADLRMYGDLAVQRRQAQLREDGDEATTIHDQQGEIISKYSEEFRTKAIIWGRVAITSAPELQ